MKARSADIVLLLVIVWTRPLALVSYWSESPTLRIGWLAAAIWGAALLTIRWATRQGSPMDRERYAVVSVLALAACFLLDLNLLRHIALAVSVVGWVNPNKGKWIAVVSCLTWLPVTDVLLQQSSALLSGARLLLAGGMLFVLGLARQESPPALPQSRPVLYKAVLAISVGICLAAWLLANCRSAVRSVDGVQAVSASGPGFTTKRIALDPVERLALGGGVATRYYVVSGDHRFLLTLIDATNQTHAIHHPSVCHGGRGWKTESDQRLVVERGDVGWLHLRRGNQRKQMLYWFVGDQSRHRSFIRNRIEDQLQRFAIQQQSSRCFVIVDLISELQQPAELLACCPVLGAL